MNDRLEKESYGNESAEECSEKKASRRNPDADLPRDLHGLFLPGREVRSHYLLCTGDPPRPQDPVHPGIRHPVLSVVPMDPVHLPVGPLHRRRSLQTHQPLSHDRYEPFYSHLIPLPDEAISPPGHRPRKRHLQCIGPLSPQDRHTDQRLPQHPRIRHPRPALRNILL